MEKSYSERLRDPRWQKLRLKILERDNWMCLHCRSKEKTLNVHHCYYGNGKDPWDYPVESLVTLCEECHEEETSDRPSAEKSLLLSLRRKAILHRAVIDLSMSFECAEFTNHSAPIVISAIGAALTNKNVQNALVNLYSEYLQKNIRIKKEWAKKFLENL